MIADRYHDGAEAYRREAARLRRQADDTQNVTVRINLLVLAQHYEALALTEPPLNRRCNDRRRRSRFPPFD